LSELLFDRTPESLEAAKWAIERGAPLDAQVGGPPLLNAVNLDYKDAVLLLLSLGADANISGDGV